MEIIKQNCKAIIELCKQQDTEKILEHTDRILNQIKKKNV